MKCLDAFKRKMELSGGSLMNENIQNSKMLLEEVFDDDASRSLNMYFWKLGLDSYENEETIRLRLYDRKYSAANGKTVLFQTLIDTPIIVGDVLFDSKSDEYWICTESYNIDEIHFQGKLTYCNWILRWQKSDGTILEYPCQDINSTQYNSGERGNQQFIIGSAQHILILPCDENTIMISTPRRFYLDKNKVNPTSYVVTQNDSTSGNFSKKGLCRITVAQTVEDKSTDRPDLGICDYIDFSNNTTNTHTVDENNLIATILYNTLSIKSGGNSQVFEAKFQDKDGNSIANISPSWNIICDFKEFLEIKESGNKIEIKIDNDDYVDEEFRLILSDSDSLCQTYLIITIDSLL